MPDSSLNALSVAITPLPLTQVKPGQGEPTMRFWPLCGYETPACTLHGAMNRVTPDRDWWRCLTCNIGVEWHR